MKQEQCKETCNDLLHRRSSSCRASDSPCEQWLLLQAQQLAQLQEDVAQHEDIDLECIREVYEHEGLRVLPAHNVETSSRYLRAATHCLRCLPLSVLTSASLRLLV